MGSRFEKKSESGYSHFVEHMLFKGTKRRDYQEISRSIDRLGGHMNASTSKELTDYYVSLSGRHLPIALDVLSDMFFHSQFGEAEFKSERQVIVEEIKMTEDQPDDVLFDFFYREQLGDNSLGRGVAGTAQSIARTTRNDLFDYYTSHYGPEGAVLSLAGALYNSRAEEKNLKKQIEKCFNHRDHKLKAKVGYTSAPFTAAEFQSPRSVKPRTFKHKSKDLEQINFVLSLPGTKSSPKETADLSVLTHYLGGTMSSRLFVELREKRGLCYSVSTFHSQFLHEGVWGIFCATSPDKFATAVETSLAELEAVASKIDASELEESKSGLKGSLELMMESAHRRASYNARMYLYHGIDRDWRQYLRDIDQVTPQTIAKAVHSLWAKAKPSVTSVGPKLSAVAAKKIAKLIQT